MESKVLGILILSGGQGKRMGGQDKGWCLHNGKPFIKLVLEQFNTQAKTLNLPIQIVISANRNIEQYESLGYPVISDLRKGFLGPLSGIESGLIWGKTNNISRWITCPVDCLSLPEDYLMQMSQGYSQKGSCSNDVKVWTDKRSHYGHLYLTTEHCQQISLCLNRGDFAIKSWLQNTNYQAKKSFHNGSDEQHKPGQSSSFNVNEL